MKEFVKLQGVLKAFPDDEAQRLALRAYQKIILMADSRGVHFVEFIENGKFDFDKWFSSMVQHLGTDVLEKVEGLGVAGAIHARALFELTKVIADGLFSRGNSEVTELC